MKKTLLVFLVPFLALANNFNLSQNEFSENNTQMEMNFENENNEHLLTYKFADNTSAIKHAIKATGSEDKVSLLSKQIAPKLPKSLTTFSLAGMYDYDNAAMRPQQRLNSLLAANDPEFPKANTLHKDLKTVPAQKFLFRGAEHIVEGFGPRIKL